MWAITEVPVFRHVRNALKFGRFIYEIDSKVTCKELKVFKAVFKCRSP